MNEKDVHNRHVISARGRQRKNFQFPIKFQPLVSLLKQGTRAGDRTSSRSGGHIYRAMEGLMQSHSQRLACILLGSDMSRAYCLVINKQIYYHQDLLFLFNRLVLNSFKLFVVFCFVRRSHGLVLPLLPGVQHFQPHAGRICLWLLLLSNCAVYSACQVENRTAYSGRSFQFLP